MRTILIICTLLFLTAAASYGQQCNPTNDSLALAALYHSTDGDNWENNSNWFQGPIWAFWYGVKLNSNGCVDTLRLGSNDLNGQIPPEIGMFSEIRYLELSSNWVYSGNNIELGGKIPPEIGNLISLEFLGLAECGLDGSIPPELGKLTNLKRLELWSNFDFGGQIPSEFGNLVSLERMKVSLSNEAPSSTIPPEFGKLKNLKHVQLTGNINGEIPTEIGGLDSLEYLYLGSNLSGEIPPELGNLKKLEYLRLIGELSGEIPPELGNLGSMEYLSLGLGYSYLGLTSNLSGEIPPEFGNLGELESLYLQGNNLTGTIPAELENLDSLNILDLSDNQLISPIPAQLSALKKLTRLDLAGNGFNGSIPPEFGDIESLEFLDLRNNNFSGSIPTELGNLGNLKYLNLSINQLNGNLPSSLETLPNLTSLSLENNNFTFEDLSNVYDIVNNPIISPQKPFYPGKTFFIKAGDTLTIDLGIDAGLLNNFYQWKKDGGSWTPPAGNSINSNSLFLPDLQVKDAGFYQVSVTNPGFTGLTLESEKIQLEICNEFSDSTQLVELYNATNGTSWTTSTNWLQANQSIDTWYGITTDAFGCVSKIDLSDNNLTDTLPALDLNTLDTLILARNSLSGSIPVFNTPFLLHIDLSENTLDGQIPVLNVPLLRYLNYSGNILNGAIPPALGDLMELRVLDLSHNTLDNTIPPDVGDLCELEEIRLNDNNFDGELPTELTMLYKLKFGRVDFSGNSIDSLKQKIAFFCPYGDTILQDNPSYDRFLGICNVQCNGDEWDRLDDFPWIEDTLATLPCPDLDCLDSYAEAGFVDVRNIKVVYTRTVCYTKLEPEPEFNFEVLFYDCGGNLLETASCDQNAFCTQFGAISREEFDSLEYDERWTCGQSLSPPMSVYEPEELIPSTGAVPLVVQPNPTSSTVTFSNRPDMNLEQLQCTNLWGQPVRVQVQTGLERTSVDLLTAVPGMYLLFVPGEGRMYTAKVVKQN